MKNKDQVSGLLDRGCSFEGRIVFDGTVQINGEFSGEITSEGTLVVGQEARVSGDLKVDTLICYGTVNGKVDAKNRIEINVPSVVTADVSTRSLKIEEGALFQGQCYMHHSKTEGRSVDGEALLDQKPTNGDGLPQEDQIAV